MPRKPKTTVDDEPATLPAVVAVTARADWSDWSADRERGRIEAEIEQRRQAEQTPIYPRELAAAIAEDAARSCVPDWRIVRDEHRALFVKLLKAQPELQQREIAQLDGVLRMVQDQLPLAFRPLVSDLRHIIELRLLGHEAAAFRVGIETGRRLEHQHVDRDGRLRTYHRKAHRSHDEPFRLHMDAK